MKKSIKNFDLPVVNGRGKSFYGKAMVTEFDNGDIELTSYNTIVCRIHKGKVQTLGNGYSATTMRNINSFLDFYGIEDGGKTWWNNLKAV